MTKSLSQKGILYLIPSALGENDIAHFISPDFKINIFNIDEFIVENIRTTRRYLRSIGYDKNFDSVIFHELNEHTNPLEINSFLSLLLLSTLVYNLSSFNELSLLKLVYNC